MTPSTHRWPILLASWVFIVGVAYLWVGPEPLFEHRCPFALDPTIQEGTGLRIDASVWPPGTECEYTFPDGTGKRSTYIPWVEWLGVAALAAGLGLASSRFIRPTARPSWKRAWTIGLPTVGVAVLLAGPGIGVLVLLLGIAIAVSPRLRRLRTTLRPASQP